MDIHKVIDFLPLVPPAGHGTRTVQELVERWKDRHPDDRRTDETIYRMCARRAKKLTGMKLAEEFDDGYQLHYHRAADCRASLAMFMSPEDACSVVMAKDLLQQGLNDGKVHLLVAIAELLAEEGLPAVQNLTDAIVHLPLPEGQPNVQRHWMTLCDACSRGRPVRVTGFAAGQVAIVSIFGLVTQGVHGYLIGGRNRDEVRVLPLDQVESIEQKLGHAWGPPDGFNLEQITDGDWLERVPSLFGNAGGQQ